MKLADRWHWSDYITWCINSKTFQYVGPPKNCRKWRPKIQWILSGPKQCCTCFWLGSHWSIPSSPCLKMGEHSFNSFHMRTSGLSVGFCSSETRFAKYVGTSRTPKSCSSYEMEFSETDRFSVEFFLQFFILKCWRSIFWKGKPPGIISISERLFRREHDALFFWWGRQCLLNWPKRFANHIWVKTKHMFIIVI